MGFRSGVRALATCSVVAGLIVIEAFHAPSALAAPNISVSQDIPAQTLIGRETPVDVSITNASNADTAYNLALSVRLLIGVHVSSSDISPSDEIIETDAAS